jgi:hypothetical protein
MAQTLNLDVVGIYDRINRFIREIQKSASANVSMTSEYDLARAKTYLSTLRFLVDHVDSQPQLDLPETNPQAYALMEAPVLQDIENENCKHLCLMLATCREELLMSQSSRMSTGFVPFDKTRMLNIVQKCESYISNFVEKATPIDLPESSPRAPVQGSGLNGLGNA